MKPLSFAIVLAAIFVMATLVTGFALTLLSPGSDARFLARFFHNTVRYGWAAGLAAAVVFCFTGTR